MLVVGYRSGFDKGAVLEALSKHTKMSKSDSNRLMNQIIKGEPVNLPDDFVLREDLESANLLIQ